MNDKGDVEVDSEQVAAATERKLPRSRACDECRRRKVRCDGSQAAAKACSVCVSLRQSCTYSPTSHAELRDKCIVDQEYIRALESEVAMLRHLVSQLRARLEKEDASSSASSASASPAQHSPYPRHPSLIKTTSVNADSANEEAFLEGFRAVSLNNTRHSRFLGRSSHFPLMKAALNMKREIIEESRHGKHDVAAHATKRRPQFWLQEFLPREPPYVNFPEFMLMNELIGNYFRMIHADLPLLHRPSFLEGVASGRHFIDEGFGAVALLVCALGARFSNNPATLPPNAQSWQFAGWQWFDQVRSMRRLVPLTTTTPSDLQVTTLAAAYVGTLAMQHTNFPLVGYGLRLAQDLGVHRRMTYGAVPTIQEEERKRAFWCLMAMDRGMATHLGRSCNLQEEDFDVDYPADCDDEYFLTDDPKTAFKQPSSRPSSIAQFVWYLKLSRINARALRELYSLQGTDNLEDPETARDIVTGLDSELNDWMDSLPQHLRYDPNRDDLPFAAQAASLHAAYYNLRIFIHRPFITTPHDVPFPFPSYAICTNAARSCIQVLERYFVLSGPALIYQYHIGSLLQSGLILLLNLWQKLRAGTTSDAAAEFAHVNKALDMLMSLELHWDVAGRVWDMLNDIMSVVLARYQQHVDNSLEQPGGDTLPDQDILSNMPSQTQNPSGYSPSSNTESSTHVSTAGSDVTEHVPDDSFGLLSSTSSWHSASFSTTNFKLVEEGFEPDFEAMIADLLPTLGYDDLLGSFGAQPHSGSAQVLGTEIATELGDSPSYESSASDWDSHFYEE